MKRQLAGSIGLAVVTIIGLLLYWISVPVHSYTINSKVSQGFAPVSKSQFAVGQFEWIDEPLGDMGYAGLLSLRSNASLFHWFFPAQQPTTNSPLIVWLQGGPGSSSMIGLFHEMGPLRVDSTMRLRQNAFSWNSKYSMLFIDNPVGTGYSFAPNDAAKTGHRSPSLKKGAETSHDEDLAAIDYSRSDECKKTQKHHHAVADESPEWSADGFATNQFAIADDLIEFLDSFYLIHPEQLKSPLYLTGESYAGKFIPHLADRIHQVNKHRSTAIPLVGIAIGDGLTDPITQVPTHAGQALALGLVSNTQASHLQSLAEASVGYICLNEWSKALSLRLRVFEYMKEATGGINVYDVRKGDVPNDWSIMTAFMRLDTTKSALNVPSYAWFGTDDRVYPSLTEDIMKSSKPYVERLLQHGYQVLLYQGQFDMRDGVLASTRWIHSLLWSGSDGYLDADRTVWKIRSDDSDSEHHVAGYVTEYQNLRRVELINAGHLAPMDQALATFKMIESFINKN